MAALSLPIGIYTYLMMRALGTLSRVCCGLAVGVCGMVDCSTMTYVVTICRALSSTFLAMDMMVFRAAIGILCTDSSSYSITCPVPSPISLWVRLVITEDS